MVKFFESSFTYNYPLPTVSLAYFLRYPNPFAKHVLSTDVISRHIDPLTQRLHTTRLVLKQSRLPSVIANLIPTSILRSAPKGENGETMSYVLEKSVVDLKEGWMETETQNLQYRGIVKVVERQRYYRPDADEVIDDNRRTAMMGVGSDAVGETVPGAPSLGLVDAASDGLTKVQHAVTFKSNFRLRDAMKWERSEEEGASSRWGFLTNWSTSAVQRTIESTSMSRTGKALAKSREGMNLVLERIRSGGLMEAMKWGIEDGEMMRH